MIPTIYRHGLLIQAYDNMIVNTLFHIGTYFEFVGLKLKALNDDLMEMDVDDPGLNEKLIIKKLKTIVDLHNEAIGFVEQFEAVISPIMLLIYILNTFTSCSILFILRVVLPPSLRSRYSFRQ